MFHMKKKKILLLLMHCALLGAMALGVLKYSEEITNLKNRGYTALQAAQNRSQSVSFASLESLEPLSHNDDAWYRQCDLIYHAAGGIDGLTYTNSKDALELTLANGSRFIEIDFRYTSDGQLVCARDWADLTQTGEAPTSDAFRDMKIYGKYSTLSAADLLSYMRHYPDLYIIIDTKESGAVQVVSELVSLCEKDDSLIRRFIIQLYDFDSKDRILTTYPFADENFLFTAYKYGAEKSAEILKHCHEQNIAVITVPHGSWSAETIAHFTDLGFVLYEHTVNRPDEAREALTRGIRGLYTDFLMPDDLL